MLADERPKPGEKSALRDAVETIFITFLIYLLVRTFLVENYRVVGHSMIPTLENDQFLVVSKLEYRLHEPKRGDIIVFEEPRGNKKKLIKRVIGLPGELLEIKGGQVFIRGQRLNEPYIKDPSRSSTTPERIPEHQYFVMGDNRNNSSDSRNWGTLPRNDIVGKAWLTYWPSRLWGVIPHETYENLP